MTTSFTGGTGVSTAGAAKGTTSTTVAYNNVAAGRLAVITVGSKPDTGTVATPSGWTLIGTATGGTGTSAADTGLTRTTLFGKILDGTETGNVTVNGTSTTSIQGAMDVYSKTLANWDFATFVSGADSTHGTNYSAASGTWSNGGINTGDWIHVGHSGDTDDSTTATSAPTISQSGSTVGTVAGRSQVRNTSGNQGMTYTWSAPVSAASANTAAVTAGFTWSVSSCGPALAARLRDYDPVSALVETCSTALDSAIWTGSAGITVSGGVASFNLTAYTSLTSVRNYKVAGSSIVMHTTTFPDAAVNTSYYAGIRISPYGNGGSDFYGIYYHGDGTISFERTGTSIVSATLNTTNHQWLRIRDDSTNIYLETSPDGSTWTVGRTLSGAELPAWRAQTGLQVVIEGGNGGTWVIDDINNAPTLEVHTTTGTGATALSASVTVATARTVARTATTTLSAAGAVATARATARTASVALAATAARTTTRTTARTASATLSAAATRSTVRTVARTATTTLSASAVTSATETHTTAGTAAVTVSATATRSTTRATARSASTTLSATATRSTTRTSARTAAVALSATAAAAGARPTAGAAGAVLNATATRSTTRTVARSAGVLLSAAASRSTVRVTAGTAQTVIGATGLVEGQEEHTTAGTATVALNATATRSTIRTVARTAPVVVAAISARSTTRVTARTAGVAVTASAVTSSAEPHTTSGSAPVALTVSAVTSGRHVVARSAGVILSALALRGTSRLTSGAAITHLTASAKVGAGLSGEPRLVSRNRAQITVSALRQSRIVDSSRPSRRVT